MHYRFSIKPHHVNLIWYQHPCHMGSSILCHLSWHCLEIQWFRIWSCPGSRRFHGSNLSLLGLALGAQTTQCRERRWRCLSPCALHRSRVPSDSRPQMNPLGTLPRPGTFSFLTALFSTWLNQVLQKVNHAVFTAVIRTGWLSESLIGAQVVLAPLAPKVLQLQRTLAAAHVAHNLQVMQSLILISGPPWAPQTPVLAHFRSCPDILILIMKKKAWMWLWRGTLVDAEWQSHENQNIWSASTTPNSRALPSCKILPCSEIRRATSGPGRLPFQPSSTMRAAGPLDCRATRILCFYGLNPPCPLHSPRANFIFSSCLFSSCYCTAQSGGSPSGAA